MSDDAPDLTTATDFHVEDVLWRRVLRGMEDYRATGESHHLADAEKSMRVWRLWLTTDPTA